MARGRRSDKPLSEPIMIYFANAYMRHSASMTKFLTNIMWWTDDTYISF